MNYVLTPPSPGSKTSEFLLTVSIILGLFGGNGALAGFHLLHGPWLAGVMLASLLLSGFLGITYQNGRIDLKKVSAQAILSFVLENAAAIEHDLTDVTGLSTADIASRLAEIESLINSLVTSKALAVAPSGSYGAPTTPPG